MKYLFLFLGLLSCPLYAQNSLEKPSIACRLICFEKGADALNELYAPGPEGAPLVKVVLSTISGNPPTALFPTEGKVTFYGKADGTGGPIAIAAVPSGATDILVLFFPNPVEQPAAAAPVNPVYRTVVFDLDSKQFPPGGCAILNVHDRDVRFIIGEHQIQLPPGKVSSLPRPQKLDKFNMCLSTFQYQNGDKWQTVYENMEHFPPEQRKLYVVYLDSKVHRARARSYNL
jgi:hypothetical protein